MSNLNVEIKPNFSKSPHKFDKAKTMNNSSLNSQFVYKHDLNLKDERNKYKLFSSQNVLKNKVKTKITGEGKSHNSPEKRKVTDNAPNLKEVINTEEYKSTSHNIVLQNTSLEKECSNVKTKFHKSSKSVNEPRKVRLYDIDGNLYDFVKTHDKIKVGRDDGTFMKRMVLDVFIRQTKDKRLNELLDKRKIRITEGDKIKAFNRLIEDANRRMEAIDNLESVKLSMEEPLPEKKYSYHQFMDVYNRYIKYNIEC
jgi:hypothetical protein